MNRVGLKLTGKLLIDMAQMMLDVEAGLYKVDNTLDPKTDEEVVKCFVLLNAAWMTLRCRSILRQSLSILRQRAYVIAARPSR